MSKREEKLSEQCWYLPRQGGNQRRRNVETEGQELYFVRGKFDKLIRGQEEILKLQPKEKVRVQVTDT